MKRIDQYLFSNIVRMSYEADKAHKEWIREYSNRSEREKRAYTSFSSKTRRITIFNKDENKELKIFDLWCDIKEEERERLINETRIIDELFIDVETFLRMFQHNV
jgi:uncharacterized membrane-anchored protein